MEAAIRFVMSSFSSSRVPPVLLLVLLAGSCSKHPRERAEEVAAVDAESDFAGNGGEIATTDRPPGQDRQPGADLRGETETVPPGTDGGRRAPEPGLEPGPEVADSGGEVPGEPESEAGGEELTSGEVADAPGPDQEGETTAPDGQEVNAPADGYGPEGGPDAPGDAMGPESAELPPPEVLPDDVITAEAWEVNPETVTPADLAFDLPLFDLVEFQETEGNDWEEEEALVVEDGTEVVEEVTPECAFGAGVCVGQVFHYCHPQTLEEKQMVCATTNPCLEPFCTDGFGCQSKPLTGTPCGDGDACSEGKLCMGGQCLPGPGPDCDDHNPCTSDSCDSETGCVHEALEGPCDDGDVCTVDDWCLAGQCSPTAPLDCDDGDVCTADSCDALAGCQHEFQEGPCDDMDSCTEGDWCLAGSCAGLPVECDEGFVCIGGDCICPDSCSEQECGSNVCGLSCGTCGAGQKCDDGECVSVGYPPGPYGPFEGDTAPNQGYLDPEDLAEVPLSAFWQQGKLILITFNAGWCIVCKQDTALFNQWHQEYLDDGLVIISILYEVPSGAPMSAQYAGWWKDYFDIQFNLLMDTPEKDSKGKAVGGGLGFYLEPDGPCPDSVFPVTLLICPDDMRLLYVHQGFYDEVVTPLVMDYLFNTDCAQ